VNLSDLSLILTFFYQFETILALSLGTRWRIHGLNAAATETGLKTEILSQSSVDHEAVDAFATLGLDGGVTKPSHGALGPLKARRPEQLLNGPYHGRRCGLGA
jgi:hypothetical protein